MRFGINLGGWTGNFVEHVLSPISTPWRCGFSLLSLKSGRGHRRGAPAGATLSGQYDSSGMGE